MMHLYWLTSQCKTIFNTIKAYGHYSLIITSATTVIIAGPQPTFQKAAYWVIEPLNLLVHLMHYLIWIIGSIFCFGSIVRYLQYRNNSSQTPLQQPVWLGIFGVILILLPFWTQQAINPITPIKVKGLLYEYYLHGI